MRLILNINQNEEEAAFFFFFSFCTQQMCLEAGALSLTHTVGSDKGRSHRISPRRRVFQSDDPQKCEREDFSDVSLGLVKK